MQCPFCQQQVLFFSSKKPEKKPKEAFCRHVAVCATLGWEPYDPPKLALKHKKIIEQLVEYGRKEMILGGWLHDSDSYSISDLIYNIDMPHEISALEQAISRCEIRIIEKGVDIGYGPSGNEGPVYCLIYVQYM